MITVEVAPAALHEATGGFGITYHGMHDGRLTVTLTRQEATRLGMMLVEQLEESRKV